MELGTIMLREISQLQTNKYHMLSLMESKEEEKEGRTDEIIKN